MRHEIFSIKHNRAYQTSLQKMHVVNELGTWIDDV